jgi:hypothetical protein
MLSRHVDAEKRACHPPFKQSPPEAFRRFADALRQSRHINIDGFCQWCEFSMRLRPRPILAACHSCNTR